MTKDDDEFDVADGGGREQRTSGGRAYLDMPDGLQVFQSKKETQPFTVVLAAFQVTEAINKFKPDLRFAKPGKWYGEQTFYYHRGVGVNNESFACPAMTCGLKCPICEDTAHLRNSNVKAEKDRGFEMKPKERQLFLPVKIDDPRPVVRLWDEANWNFGKHLYAYIRGAMPDEREAMKQYYNPLAGYEIRVNPQEEPGGKGGKPNVLYHVHGMRRLREPLPRELFRHGYDLSAIVRVLDYKTLRDIYMCGAEVSDAVGSDRQADRTSVSVSRDDGWSRPTNGWNTDGPSPHPRQTSEAPPRRQPEPEPESQPARRADRQGWDTTGPAQPAISQPRGKAPAEPAGDDPEFAVGDEVTTYYRKEWHTGQVVEVIASRRLYRVDVGWDQPLSVAFEDAKAVTPAKPAPRRQPDPEPELEPAPPPRRRAPAPPPGAEEPPPPKPATRRAPPPADPQDDAPPARAPQPRRPAVPQDDDLDDPPAPRRRA